MQINNLSVVLSEESLRESFLPKLFYCLLQAYTEAFYVQWLYFAIKTGGGVGSPSPFSGNVKEDDWYLKKGAGQPKPAVSQEAASRLGGGKPPHNFESADSHVSWDDEGHGYRGDNQSKYGHQGLMSAFLYTGKEYDFGIGHYHMDARSYDPRVGGFMQRDPYNLANVKIPSIAMLYIGLTKNNINQLKAIPNQHTSYEYVANNPLKFNDPFGLDVYNFSDKWIVVIDDDNGRNGQGRFTALRPGGIYPYPEDGVWVPGYGIFKLAGKYGIYPGGNTIIGDNGPKAENPTLNKFNDGGLRPDLAGQTAVDGTHVWPTDAEALEIITKARQNENQMIGPKQYNPNPTQFSDFLSSGVCSQSRSITTYDFSHGEYGANDRPENGAEDLLFDSE